MKTSDKNREQWLNEAVALCADLFPTDVVPFEKVPVRISVGFPSRGGLATKKQRIGECWTDEASDDKVHQLFISPVLSDPIEVLGVVIHEMVHAYVGVKAGHRGPFRKLAKAVGLEGKMTATTVSDQLRPELEQIANELGEYPHAKLEASSGPKKQSTRMLKVECPGCGYTLRTTQKWLDVGVPTCCCGEEMEQTE